MIIKANAVTKTINAELGSKVAKTALVEILSTATYPLTIEITTKNFVLKNTFDTKIEASELESELKSIVDSIKDMRKERKEVKTESRTFLSGAINYKTIGGVFPAAGTVKTLIGPDFKKKLLDVNKVPNSAEKQHYVGLELELCAMVEMDQMKKAFIDANLHRYVQVGSDGSVNTHKGGRPYEIRVMCLEKEVEDVVTRVCAVLNSKPVLAYVNSSCGFHVHLDARSRDPEHVFKNLVMGLPLLSKMVPQERISSLQGRTHYCKQNETGIFKKALEGGDRYLAINPMSFTKQKTIEVRLHSGTVNAKKIINWVKVLTTLINQDTKMSKKIHSLEDFKAFSTDTILHKYMARRIATFAEGDIDTATDESLDAMIENGTLSRIIAL